MTLPNFLIIGAAKAGTTALHSYLKQHPQIYMTPDKETNFFAFEGETLKFNGIGDRAIEQFSITDLATYEQEFQGVKEEKAIGEACPLYLYNEKAVERIYHYIPNAKLIVILRNPVDRAYANFLHLIRDDREPEKDFGKALEAEFDRIANHWEWFWHYIQLGFYHLQLERYYQQFNPDQIRVYLYEDLRDDALKLIQNIFAFLEVETNFEPDMTIRPNKSGMPKNELLHKLLTKPNPLKSLVKPLLPASFRQKIQHKNLQTPTITPEVREKLINIYKEDILACQKLIDRDLSSWLS
ncbi:sulfotransferase family protein [Geminocystis sp. CENA526]|uniref:sulfotransferase family protein n=1 Tax=Geminocystis sp. CENA526 TaxID=1355871 RepID=UPI003D6E71ED